MSIHHGDFCWYELMTPDPQAAAAFYSGVFGWTATDSGMPGMSYTLLGTPQGNLAGVMALPDEMRQAGVPPNWTGYIAVDDVDGQVQRIVAAGGRVNRPAADIPGVGRFAVVADPQGAVFVVFKGSGEPPPTGMNHQAPGQVGWHELHAGDGKAAWDFYAGQFGWQKSGAVDMGPSGVYQLFSRGGADLGGMMTKMPDTPMPCWMYYVNVEAVDAAMARVTKGGGKIVMGPHEVPGPMWIAVCTDPQGAVFAMVGPTR